MKKAQYFYFSFYKLIIINYRSRVRCCFRQSFQIVEGCMPDNFFCKLYSKLKKNEYSLRIVLMFSNIHSTLKNWQFSAQFSKYFYFNWEFVVNLKFLKENILKNTNFRRREECTLRQIWYDYNRRRFEELILLLWTSVRQVIAIGRLTC